MISWNKIPLDLIKKYAQFINFNTYLWSLSTNTVEEPIKEDKDELVKIIEKKLVRKTLDMIKKIDEDKYNAFWSEYSTNIKLGVNEDSAANRTSLAKLLRFVSSNGWWFPDEVERSLFVERLIKKG